MKTIHMDIFHPSYKALREVSETIQAGGVMVYPTDTIYGLGCGVHARAAMERISEIKKRDAAKPFSFICANIEQISEFAFVSNWAYKLMKRTLPGPYTFILEARRNAALKKMLGRRHTVGVRIPDSPICSRLVELIGKPIVSTSVNLAGEEPLCDPSILPESFSHLIDVVIDVGPLGSEPSTVVDLTGDAPLILREGKGEFPK